MTALLRGRLNSIEKDDSYLNGNCLVDLPKQSYFCTKITWEQDLEYIITEESHEQKDGYFNKKATG